MTGSQPGDGSPTGGIYGDLNPLGLGVADIINGPQMTGRGLVDGPSIVGRRKALQSACKLLPRLGCVIK